MRNTAPRLRFFLGQSAEPDGAAGKKEHTMVRFEYTVTDENGIHARPAGMLVNCAKGYRSQVRIRFGEKEADAKRILSVMSLGARKDGVLAFEVCGEDEEAAAEGILGFCRAHL